MSSLFASLVSSKINELEELKKNIPVEIETRLKREAHAVLSKFSEKISSVESEVALERERLLFEALIRSREVVAETYEQMLRDLIEAVYSEIDKLRGSERYARLLARLLESSLKYVQSRDVVIYVSPRDRGVVEAVARNMGITGIVAERDIRGGIIVASKDGSIMVDYSIETLLSNMMEDLKHLVYAEVHER
ncbi:MAG: V-type ATP synthase subunit E [Thermoproteaceae archaeon]|nr:V-type ATP synthase subunit E [Thermoproteaceae archaeon]